MKHLVTVAAALAAAVVLLSCSASAGDCVVVKQSQPPVVRSSDRGYDRGYGHEIVRVKEIVVPILQPLPFFIDPRISYLYNGGNYVQVPFATGPSPYQQPPAPAQPARAAQSKEQDLDALIDAIERRARERQGEQANEPEGPPRVPGFAAKKQATAGAARTGQSVLAGRCAGCHTGDRAKGDFVIFDSPGKLSRSFDSAAAWDAINEGRMPPRPRAAVPAADKEIVRRDFGVQ